MQKTSHHPFIHPANTLHQQIKIKNEKLFLRRFPCCVPTHARCLEPKDCLLEIAEKTPENAMLMYRSRDHEKNPGGV